MVWAVPRLWARTGTAHELRLGRDLFRPPRPAEALPVEEVLRGDGSPAASLQASLLVRELGEYAALWHGASWGDYDIVDRLPTELWPPSEGPWFKLSGEPAEPPPPPPPPRWTAARVSELAAGSLTPFPLTADLRPRVEPRPDGEHTVVFYTYNRMGMTRVTAHLDHHAPGGATIARSVHHVIATAGFGAVH